MNLLTELVNKSLVIFDDEGNEPRYHMLETVRQYARDKLLEMGESEEARNAHLDFFFQLTELAAPEVLRLQDLEWVTRLEIEYDNLRAALEWGLEKNIEAALRMVWNLYVFWLLRGLEAEGRQWATAILAKADTIPELKGEAGLKQKALRTYALGALAHVMWSQGDISHAAAVTDQVVALADELGDKYLLSYVLGNELAGKMIVGDSTGIQSIVEESLAAANESGNRLVLGFALAMSGLKIILTNDDRNLGYKQVEQGEKILLGESRWMYTMSVLGLALVAKYRGDYSESRRRFAICDPIFREIGDMHRVNMVRSELAHMERYEGHYQQAKAMYRESIVEWKRIGHRAAIAHQLECFASIAKIEEQGQRAARLFGAAEALREKIDIPMTDMEHVEYEREISELKAGMDEKVFVSAWTEGRALTMEQAIDFALERNK